MAKHNPPRDPVALVVDDEALLRMYAAGILKQEGFQVIEAASAREALEVLKNNPDVRLLFTDINRPHDVDGLELAQTVHARWPSVLLVLTSGGKAPYEDDIPDDGRFVAKPYTRGDLMNEVDDLMRHHK